MCIRDRPTSVAGRILSYTIPPVPPVTAKDAPGVLLVAHVMGVVDAGVAAAPSVKLLWEIWFIFVATFDAPILPVAVRVTVKTPLDALACAVYPDRVLTKVTNASRSWLRLPAVLNVPAMFAW